MRHKRNLADAIGAFLLKLEYRIQVRQLRNAKRGLENQIEAISVIVENDIQACLDISASEPNRIKQVLHYKLSQYRLYIMMTYRTSLREIDTRLRALEERDHYHVIKPTHWHGDYIYTDAIYQLDRIDSAIDKRVDTCIARHQRRRNRSQNK